MDDEEKEYTACILTGEPGENPDDCTTHEHEELVLELDDGPYELDFDALDLDQESWEWIHDQVVFEDNEYELE